MADLKTPELGSYLICRVGQAGLSRFPFTEEITGSNPVRDTIKWIIRGVRSSPSPCHGEDHRFEFGIIRLKININIKNYETKT